MLSLRVVLHKLYHYFTIIILLQVSLDIMLIAASVKHISLIRYSKPRLNGVFVHAIVIHTMLMLLNFGLKLKVTHYLGKISTDISWVLS